MTTYSTVQLMRIKWSLGSKVRLSGIAWDTIKSLGISAHSRGTRAGIHKQRQILTRISTRSRPMQYVNRANVNNLVKVYYDSNRIPTVVSSVRHPSVPQQTGCNSGNLCKVAARAKELLDGIHVTRIQLSSAGAATFYVWAKGVLDSIEQSRSLTDVEPASIALQKKLFGQTETSKTPRQYAEDAWTKEGPEQQ